MSPEDQITNENLRSSPRQRTILRGTIFVNAVDAGHPCMIRNISEGGARIEMPDTSWVPKFFTLAIPGRELLTEVEVAWRADRSLGVSFIRR